MALALCRTSRTALLMLVLASGLPQLSLIQAREVAVLVTDKDLELPLEGVVVTLPDGTTTQTDAEGRATIGLPDEQTPQRLRFSLIGYEPTQYLLTPDQSTLELALSIAGVVEGSELVVEAPRPQQTDAQTGVSRVATRPEIKNTAEIGVMEDLMSTIKTLPGVGYNSGFNAKPSIDGGAPNEFAATLDGALVAWPFQWGSVVSIFDPNMVETAKLSKGMVSARYGQVISGLLEVTSRAPDGDLPRLDASLSTTGLDLFSMLPFGDTAGLLVGGKVTWISLIFPILPLPIQFDAAPYITNGYGRFWLKPANTLEWNLNAFVGNDGVGMTTSTTRDRLTSSRQYSLENPYLLLASKLRGLLGPDLLLDTTLSWNHLYHSDQSTNITNGSVQFSQAFIDKYKSQLGGATGYTVDNLTSSNATSQTGDLLQAKASLDGQLTPEHLLAGGLELSFQNLDWERRSTTTAKVTTTTSFPHSRQTNEAAFLLWNGSFLQGLLETELGLRLDHSWLFNDSLSLNTLPVFNPRLRLVLTPVRGGEAVSQLSFSLGSGLYSQLNLDTAYFDPVYGLKDFSLSPDRAWSSLAGAELETADGWKFSLEGYYKYYLNRFFITTDPATNPATLSLHTDGTGQSWGVDLMIQRQLNRWWDGWLSYSFNSTRLFNPAGPGDSGQSRTNRGPWNQEFYPGYHRFHTLNLVSVWKPLDGFSLMIKATLASGTPRAELGPLNAYLSVVNGVVTERYTRTSTYSDTLRTDPSLPVDIKLAWHGFFADSRVEWEAYLAVQDAFVNLYTPVINESYDSYTGSTVAQTASFNIGFPLPSLGLKINF